jgi:hypothetical protein
MVGEARAEHAYFTRAGDVDKVGLEAVKDLADDRNVARKRRVKSKVSLKGEGEDAPRQLQSPHIAVFDESLTAISCADTEEWEIPAASKGFEMTAGMCDSIDFVKGVWEVRNARKMSVHDVRWTRSRVDR